MLPTLARGGTYHTVDGSSDHVDAVDVRGQTKHVLRKGQPLSLCGPGQGTLLCRCVKWVCQVSISGGCAVLVEWECQVGGCQVGVSGECVRWMRQVGVSGERVRWVCQ